MQWIEAASNIAVGGAALVGAWLAYQGLHTWRSQKNHDYARRVLEIAVEIYNRISQLRTTGYGPGDEVPLRQLSKEFEHDLARGKAAAILAEQACGTPGIEQHWSQFDTKAWLYVASLRKLELHREKKLSATIDKVQEWETIVWPTTGG